MCIKGTRCVWDGNFEILEMKYSLTEGHRGVLSLAVVFIMYII